MIERLKSLQIEHIDLDEAVALLTFGRSVRASYAEFEMDVPAWLDEKLTEITREIRDRRRDYLTSELKAALARRESLRTAEEKREAETARIAKLQAALGITG